MGYLVAFELAGRMTTFGAVFSDVEAAFLFINRNDPDGTVRSEIIDQATGRSIDFAAYLDGFDRVARPLQPHPPRQKFVPEKGDWKIQGF